MTNTDKSAIADETPQGKQEEPRIEALIHRRVAAALRQVSYSVPMGPDPDPASYLVQCAEVWEKRAEKLEQLLAGQAGARR